jgi:putative ABC transport system permease protein
MKRFDLIIKSLWHYRRRNLTVALGMAVGMAVITGALVTGDSVRAGLRNLVTIRLGQTDLDITSGDRYFTDSMAMGLSSKLGIPVATVLQSDGSATAGGGQVRIPKVSVYGIDDNFPQVLGPGTFNLPSDPGGAVISDNLAERLAVGPGDEILVRINRPGPVPVDAPFVSDEGNIVTLRLKVEKIAGVDSHGRFHLQKTQTAPMNIFVSRRYLQESTRLGGYSNLILLASGNQADPANVMEILAGGRSLADAGIDLRVDDRTGEWFLQTPRIFLDPPTRAAIEKLPFDKTFYFSYFVNEFKSGSRSSPYSFVSTLPGNQVGKGQVLINRWLADDLEAVAGDSVTLRYYRVGPLRKLTVESRTFVIAGIIPMDDPRCDPLLMPDIPGLSDAGSCSDWHTSVPIDLKRIRDRDEKYWDRYRGTPKAFLNPEEAAELWANPFGSYTQVRFPASTPKKAISSGILSNLKPADTGLRVETPLHDGLAAASAGVDFSSLFLGLSFFLIAGGIILTILLIRLSLESRQEQVGTLKALGWPEKAIRQVLFLENGWVALAGGLLGLGITWLYTLWIFRSLNGVWNDIVLTDTLRPVFRPRTLLTGFFSGILISLGSAWWVLRRYFRTKPADLIRKARKDHSPLEKRLLNVGYALTGITALVLTTYGLTRIQTVGPTWFFSAGSLLLLSLILLSIRIFHYRGLAASGHFTAVHLSRSNLYRNSNRSLSVILLFAIGIFLVMAVGANRKNEGPSTGAGARTSGTGGFTFFLQTTVPIPDNLNNPAVRAKYGLDTPADFIQMKVREGDDASCLNLNRVKNPPILSVPPGAFEGRFRFLSLSDKAYRDDPWNLLNKELPGGAIPAIADQTVIQWGLGLKLGDTLKYQAENGDTVRLVLAGGLDNSVFQGNILISRDQFIRHWPSVSGTRIILASVADSLENQVQSELRQVFRDYGPDLKTAPARLAEFNSIENPYLSIFLVMGSLAMLLGTIGLAIVLARNLQERRSEIALLRATGFSGIRIMGLVFREYAFLLLYGTAAGGLSSMISVLPGWVGTSPQVSPAFLIGILLVLPVNGLVWIGLLGWYSIRKPGIIRSLRNE